MNTELSFGQRIDPENNLVECWFTHGALDAIKEMDLSDKIVWMFGAGKGDLWLSKRCKELHVVERNGDWLNSCVSIKESNRADNLFYYYRPCNDSSGEDEYYCEIPIKVDVVINDDAYRYEVIVKALSLPRPITLIVDNFMQAFVFICPAAVELLKDFEGTLYEQENHQDHDGVNKWKTGIWNIKQ